MIFLFFFLINVKFEKNVTDFWFQKWILILNFQQKKTYQVFVL